MKKKIIHLKKYFHSGTVSFDGLILTAVKVITMVVSLINTMILSRLLSLSEYGTYSQLLSIISIVSIVSSMGLNNAVNYFYNKSDEEKEKSEYISTIFFITILIGFIFGLILVLFSNNIAVFYNNPSLSTLIVYIAFKPVLDNIIAVFQPLFISLKKAKKIAIINVIISIIKVIVVTLGYVITKKIFMIFIVQVSLDILQIIILHINIKNLIPRIKLTLNNKYIKEIIKYSLPLTLALMSGIIFKESDKIVVSKLSTIENLAIYSNMSKQLPFEFVVTSFTAVVTPIIVKHIRNNKSEAIKLWKNYFQFSYTISWILNFGAIVCAKEMLIFLYSEKYIGGLNIFIIYLIVEIFRFTYFGLILSASGNTKLITISSVISVILNIILNIVLYIVLGIAGPAIATLITVIVMGVMQFTYSLKILNVKCLDIINFKEIFKYIIQLTVIGIICYIIKMLLYKIISNYIIILIIIYTFYVIINLLINKKKIMYLIKEMK